MNASKLSPADKFEVVRVDRDIGVSIYFANFVVTVLRQDLTGLRAFHQILVKQAWIRARVRVHCSEKIMTFDIRPNNSELTFSVDGQTWNLEQRDVYIYITAQIGKLIDELEKLLGAHTEPVNPLITESTKVVDFGHCWSIVCSFASGDHSHFDIGGLKGLIVLLHGLVRLQHGCSVHDEVKDNATVESFEMTARSTTHCVQLDISYKNNTSREVMLSYNDVRCLVDSVVSNPMLESALANEFDFEELKDIINKRYSVDSIVKHDVSITAPAPEVHQATMAEICRFLIDHPEYDTFILGLIRERQANQKVDKVDVKKP